MVLASTPVYAQLFKRAQHERQYNQA